MSFDDTHLTSVERKGAKPGVEHSARVRAAQVKFLIPSTIIPELFNAFFQRYRSGHVSLNEVRELFSSLEEAPVSFFEIDPLNSRTAETLVGSLDLWESAGEKGVRK